MSAAWDRRGLAIGIVTGLTGLVVVLSVATADAQIYSWHTDDGTFYYVMEYLPGLNLGQLVQMCGPIPAGRAIHLVSQTCEALSEAHHQGVIHRDIKPGNIFAARRGGVFDVAKLLDFGLA